MSNLSLDQFLALVERSQLVDQNQLTKTVDDWKRRAAPSPTNPAQACADHLVEAELLTSWQSRKLLEGRHRGFYLGKYKLLDHLGSGGMSNVYLAEHVLMQRRVAIKVLPQHRLNDGDFLARFHLEAQAAAALDHRNIVRAYDLDNEAKIHYLVMEYVEGHDLHAIVAHEGPLDFHEAANFIAQAAAGLEHAHHAGLIHRDIKPANLLVDLKGTVKILDMGLAKFMTEGRAHPEITQEDQVLGTADYLAPEQAVNSQAVDHRADIYSLGCTFYFLLTGHPPFAEGTSQERIAAHQQQIPSSILLDRPDAPPALVAICRRMMEKSPLNRFQSALEVQQALSAWLESEVAAGKASSETLAAVGRVLRRQNAQRDRPPSKINLVSGSAVDLQQPFPDSTDPSSSPQDTDSDSPPRTRKIAELFSNTSGESEQTLSSQSDVLPSITPPPISGSAPSGSGPSSVAPVPPPIASPPPSAPEVPYGTALQDLAPNVAAPLDAPLSDPAWQKKGFARFHFRRRARPASALDLLWVGVISALLLLALLLGLAVLLG